MADRWWEAKGLDDLSPEEWEALCDGCGKCCWVKARMDDGTYRETGVRCRVFDTASWGCGDYAGRTRAGVGCVQLTPEIVRSEAMAHLPDTCGYRRVAEGRPLADWHPLVNGGRLSRERWKAGAGVKGRPELVLSGDTLFAFNDEGAGLVVEGVRRADLGELKDFVAVGQEAGVGVAGDGCWYVDNTGQLRFARLGGAAAQEDERPDEGEQGDPEGVGG